jgi:hypothetical protein
MLQRRKHLLSVFCVQSIVTPFDCARPVLFMGAEAAMLPG